MSSESQQDLLHDLLSESDISELDLDAAGLTVVSSDESEAADASDCDSESSYDPSVATEDEEFIDDSDDSDNSNDSYEHQGSVDDSTDDDATGSDDSDEHDDTADSETAASEHANILGVETDSDSDCSTDDLEQGASSGRTRESSVSMHPLGKTAGYYKARTLAVKRCVPVTCIILGCANDLSTTSSAPSKAGMSRSTQGNRL
jgi:hypothetical protein